MWKRPHVIVALTALGWTVLTTATSQNVALSVRSLLYAAACAVFFVASCISLSRRSWSAIYVLFVPAVANVIVLSLQHLRIWDFYPLSSPSTGTALIGNPNDVGAYLLVPAIAAAAVYVSSTSGRVPHLVLAVVLAAGVLMSRSVTALLSYAVAIIVMTALRSWRIAVSVVSVAAIVLVLAVAAYRPLGDRVERLEDAIAHRDYNAIISHRLTAFVVAVQMFTQRPIVGIGPGCYGWSYFFEKVKAEARHPLLRASGERAANFGEAHSDYLQVLALTGLPGLIILATASVVLARQSTSSASGPGTDVRRQLAKTFALPLATGMAMVMMAQFPLELAGCTMTTLFAAAVCFTWSNVEGG